MALFRRKRGRGLPAAFIGLLAGILVLLPSSVPHAATPGGTLVHNVAGLAYGPVNSLYNLQSGQTTVTVVNPADVLNPFRKSVEPAGQVSPGSTVRYTATFGNGGAEPLTNVSFTDNLASHLVYVEGSATLPQGLPGASVAYDPAARRITWTIPSLPPGYGGTVGFRATVDPATPSDTAIPNTIGGTSDQAPDPKPTNQVLTVAVEQPLRITMTASRSEAEIGESVVYFVRVENTGGTMTADNVVVTGILPFGFRYAKGTSHLDNVAVTDPVGGNRPAWPVGTMAPGAVRTLKFRAVLTGEAGRSDGLNRAYAEGRSPGGNAVTAGPAQCRVKVLEGVLGSRGVVLGRVFLDRNDDRMPGDDEPGFAGIRIYLEDGTFAETDKEGKYSISGIRAGERVLKLDRGTLPPGLVPVPLDATFAGDGGSRFVSLPFGGNARGDFALRPSPSFDNGCLPGAAAPEESRGRMMVFGTDAPTGPPSLEVRIQHMPATPEILEPADNAVLARPYSDIAVRVPEGAVDTLRVNGSAVPRESIGRKIHESERKIYIYQYIGVKLSPGPNTIALETRTPGGGTSVSSITVTVPGPPSRIVLSPAKADVGADGSAPVPFTATLLDFFGKISTREQLLTVVLARGKVAGDDLDPAMPGHQVKAVGGVASFAVRGAGETGPETLAVRAGSSLVAEADVFFVPKPRAWVVAGIADVTAGANTVSGDIGGTDDDRMFKDGFSHDERLALFAKGSIGDGYVLTGSYDTAKGRTDPLFGREDPAKYYPMYGDGSRTGYDAASGDKLYLKVEKGRSYALYGDYRTDLTQADFARYDRTFTGAKADLDLGVFSVRAFGAETGRFLAKDELRGNGTSGFYFLTRRPVVEGSERVRIEVRDRFHAERVLSTVDKASFTDYSIDYESGSILFKEPVPSLDAGMNPVHIVALYESEGGGGEFYTFGGRAALKPWQGLEVGATAVREDRNLETASLAGVDATLKVGKALRVSAEVAGTDTAGSGKGTAWKVEAEGAPSAKTAVSAYYRSVDRKFENLSAQSAEPGTVKYGAKADHRVTPSTGLKAEGYVEESETAGTKLTSVAGSVSHAWDNVSVETGYRNLRDERDDPAAGDSDSHMAFASASRRLTDRATATLAHSQILSGEGIDQYETETSAGLEYRLTEAVKASITGNWQWTGEKRRAVLFGLETRVAKNTVLTSRYEIEDTASGERLQSLVGLNRQWSPRGDLKLDGRVEWIDYQRGTDDTGTAAAQEGVAVALAAEYLPREDVKATGRTEVRFGDLEDTVLLSFGVGWKVGPDLGLLARASLWNADRGAGSARRYDALAGVAYRPKGIRSIYLLDTVRYIAERDGTLDGVDSKRIVTSNDVSWRVHPRLTLSGKYAGKYAWDRYEGDGFGAYSDLLVAGAAYDLTDRWDVGAQGKLSTQYSSGARELSALVRTGYRVVKNLYAGAGYNFARMNDGDFSGSGWRSHGPFLELKLKFDEATLYLPGWDKTPAPPSCPKPPSVAAAEVRRVDAPVDVVGSVEMPAFLVNGSEVALPGADAVLAGHLPDGSLRIEGSAFYEPVRFRVRSGAAGSPSAWKLTVLGAGDNAVRTLAGGGAPPAEIAWDGRAEDGRTVEGGAVYRYRMEVSYADNGVTMGAVRDFAVNRVSAVSLNLTGSAFVSGSDVLSVKARKALEEIASVLERRPEERVMVEGHTDDVGTEEYNMDLSRRRAMAAASFLVKECGIAPDRFAVLWFGESRPIAPNDVPEGRELNRRVELKGDFQETLRASVTDRFRTEPSVRVNGDPLEVDSAGRFRAKLPAETGRIDLEMTAADGRHLRTSVAVPSIRVEPVPGPGRVVVSGWTEPGNVLDVDGKRVPVRADGGFSQEVSLLPGGARVGLVVKSPAGALRILHLEAVVAGSRGKEAAR